MTYHPLPQRQRVGVAISGRRLLGIGVVSTVLGLLCLGMIGCTNPTAPTFSLFQWEAIGQTCPRTPGMPPRVSGEPEWAMRVALWPAEQQRAIRGMGLDPATTVAAKWPNAQGLFVEHGPFYAVCLWVTL